MAANPSVYLCLFNGQTSVHERNAILRLKRPRIIVATRILVAGLTPGPATEGVAIDSQLVTFLDAERATMIQTETVWDELKKKQMSGRLLRAPCLRGHTAKLTFFKVTGIEPIDYESETSPEKVADLHPAVAVAMIPRPSDACLARADAIRQAS